MFSKGDGSNNSPMPFSSTNHPILSFSWNTRCTSIQKWLLALLSICALKFLSWKDIISVFTRHHHLKLKSAFLLLSEQKLLLDIFVVGKFSLWDDTL